MNEDLSIAVVIPCYNSEKTIGICINSVLNQSVKVDELIIIDDGSTDETKNIVKRIFNSLPGSIRTILIEQSNQGPSLARNKGVEISESTYIAFLDSDDKWFPDNIMIAKQFIKDNIQYDIISTKYQSAPISYNGEITFNKLLFKNYFITPCVIVKKETFYACNGFNEQMYFSEDYFLWLNIMYKGKGYLLSYIGAGSIENKKPFGQSGLSSNLKGMHDGVTKSYKQLLNARKLPYLKYLVAIFVECIKYSRRLFMFVLPKQ